MVAGFMRIPRVAGMVVFCAGMCLWGVSSAGSLERMLRASAAAAPRATQPEAPPAAAVELVPAATPAGPVRLIDLPKLDNKGIRQLIASLLTRFELEGGYVAASEAQKRLLPVPGKVTATGQVLARTDAEKKTYLLRLGYVRQPGQLPQLWSSGLTLTPGPSGANPDADKLEGAINAIFASQHKSDASTMVADLEFRVIKLGYVDAGSALFMLKSMGFRVLGAVGAPEAPPGEGEPAAPTGALDLPATVSNDQLPMVFKMPGPNAQNAGLVGADAEGAAPPGPGQFGVSVVMGTTSKLAAETISSPTSQLMVMFNPERPEQFARVKKSIIEFIDRPARQILIEGMVLEISSNGLNELGVQWNWQEGMNTLLLGGIKAGANLNTLEFNRDSTRTLNKEFFLKLQALVTEGKAEVLARPSVLTLDNRQATIRVGTDIPIATSRSGVYGTDTSVSLSFNYLPTGIQLNVRPRIDSEGREVSMLIDATVSATVLGQDLEVRNPTTGQVLASAPTVSTRRVQTYARIPDNTPLIIGGLISKDSLETVDKVPLLGDVPVFGSLFRANQGKSSKREVIIVLTPYILPEGRSSFAQALPKDDAAFDTLNNELFRDAYRLRAGDVFDTGYIRSNRRLHIYRELTQRIAEYDPPRVQQPPFLHILDDGIPGERNLIAGMIYETLRRRHIGGKIVANRMLTFEQGDTAKFRVKRLDRVIAERGDGEDYRSFFSLHPDKCLAVSFLFERRDLAAGSVLGEPKPEIAVVDCRPDRGDWKQVLYDMNRPTADMRERHTILIKDETDIVKLSRAIMIKQLIKVNGGQRQATIGNFLVGRQIAIPDMHLRQTHLIEAEVARLFYLTEFYYPAFEEQFERTLSQIDRTLRSGEFADFIKPEEIPAVRQTESFLRGK